MVCHDALKKFPARAGRRPVTAWLLVLIVLGASPWAVQAQSSPQPQAATVAPGEVLTLERAVAVALSRHPAVLAARSAVDVYVSRIGQAKSDYLPRVDFSGGYTRGYTARQSGAFTRSGSYDSYTGKFTGSQNIYDFGRTSSRVDIEKYNTESSRSDLEDTIEQVVLNLKQAWFGLLQAQRNRAVAEETVGQFRQHLEQAQGFYEVGTKSKFDVTKAEVDLSNANLNLIRADNAVRIAKVTLDNAIGLTGSPAYTIEDTLSFQPYEVALDDALQKAFQARPDLQSIIARKKAAEQSIRYAATDYYPYLIGKADFGWTGDFPLDNEWTVGAAINIPIFSGFETKYRVQEAKANLRILDSDEESIRQAITLDVQQAFLNLGEARQRISTAELAVRQAAENLDLANGRYAEGVGSPIEVTDALVNYSNAKTGYNQALYDYKIAAARMDRAIGNRY